MSHDDKSAECEPADRETTERFGRAPRGPDDGTVTTEQVRVGPGEAVPFSLPHVSELDEVDAARCAQRPAEAGYHARFQPDRTAAAIFAHCHAPADCRRAKAACSRRGRGLRPSDPTLPPAPFARFAMSPGGSSKRRPQTAVKLMRKPGRKRRLLGLPAGCIWLLARDVSHVFAADLSSAGGRRSADIPAASRGRMDRAHRHGGQLPRLRKQFHLRSPWQGIVRSLRRRPARPCEI